MERDAATLEPVLCIVVFDHAELNIIYVYATGLDLFAPLEGNENNSDLLRKFWKRETVLFRTYLQIFWVIWRQMPFLQYIHSEQHP
jgi:hypothetical protein